MTWWLALLVFVFSIIDDILVVYYLRRVVDSDYVKASLASMAVGCVQILGIYFVIKDSLDYSIPLILGNGVGTTLAIWLEKKYPAKKSRDKKTGQFKPQVPVASFQVGDKK